MKKLLLTLMMGCAVMTAVAQNPKGKFSLRPMAGVSVSTFGLATIGGMYHTKVGFTGGAELEYGVNDWLGLSLGAIYSQQGAKIDERIFFYEEDERGNVIIEDSKMDGKLKCDYLNLPLMANIYIPAVRGLAVKAGIQVGILVNDWMNTDINTWKDVRTPPSYEESTGGVPLWENNPESLVSHAEGSGVTKSVDFGVPVGLSYEYKNVSLDVRYYIGLTKVDKTENLDNARNRCLSITLGYRFHL